MKSLEDILYPFLKVYDNLPSFIKLILAKLYNLIPKKKTLGQAFFDFKMLISETQFDAAEKHFEYQNKCFLETIEAAKKTKFYPKYYASFGIDINNIKSINDIDTLPFINKSTLQENGDEMVVEELRSNALYLTTGGSSGTPTGLYYQKGISRGKEQAFIENIWSEIGCERDSKSISFRGKVTAVGGEEKLFKYDYVRNWLHLSSFHLTADRFSEYINEINKFKPKYIQGYPSAITMLCKLMNQNNVVFPFKIDGVLVGSENISIEQIDLIESTLNTKLITWYGHSEIAVLGGHCIHSRKYHVFPQYGYTEMIDKNDQLIKNGSGEIVGTNFHNNVFPLIRYKTGDRAKISEEQSCNCGRNYLMLDEIEGREQEFLVAEGKRLIGMASLIVHDRTFNNIKQYQFIQNSEEEVLIKYTKLDDDIEIDESIIVKRISAKLGKGVNVKISNVSSIPLSKRGKIIPLIQNLDLKKYST